MATFNSSINLTLLPLVFQGIVISHNASARVIRSNQSLVLQKVTRKASGNYSCSAINAEGETVSNQLPLRVKCKFSFTRQIFPWQTEVFEFLKSIGREKPNELSADLKRNSIPTLL